MPNKEQLLEMKAHLVRRRVELADRLDAAEETLEELQARVPEVEEMAERRSRIAKTETLKKMLLEEMEGVDRALSKIAADTFGICEDCGSPIGWERLRALPWTPVCIRCARDDEAGAAVPSE